MASWSTEGYKPYCDDGDLLADTGAVGGLGAILGVSFMGVTASGGWVKLHQRNAANNADIQTQRIYLPTGMTTFGAVGIALAASQRLTVTADQTFGGAVQVSLFT